MRVISQLDYGHIKFPGTNYSWATYGLQSVDNLCYNVKMRKEKEIIITCGGCKTKISLPPYRIRQGAKFCSKHCSDIGREKGIHNMSREKIYKVWTSMKSRCHNTRDPRYKDYGGRGIIVCPEWRNSFENFWNDIKDKYKKGLIMDRINNNEGYSKTNIRFLTPLESQQNTRRTRLLTFNGETLSLSAWGRKLGISYVSIIRREKMGLPIEKILTPKV